jgi:hypothetical protein
MFGKLKNKIEADDRLKTSWIIIPCVKTTLTLWVTLEFHNAKVISMSVYSDLDAMDEGKFFARIPSILKESAENLALKNKEIADIKEQTKASKAEKHLKEKTLKATLKKLKLQSREKEDKVIGRQLMTSLLG